MLYYYGQFVLDRGSEFSRFYEAVITKVVVPFEQLLNQLEPPVTYILANVELSWRIRIELGCNSQEKTNSDNDPDDIQWLDSQPVDFVLNISLGSFLSVSSAQMDEILAGLQMSGVRFLRVARGDASRLNQTCGGFLTHRGSNSILKIFMLALLCSLFLFSLDQHPNKCVGRFMDLESNEGKEMRRVARQFRDSCGEATTAEGG
ncbi:hypothetical protein CUMW_031600 [Citrus unshiu]|nr:hypothetical protein CUMW_031600 [Citrus unshiu]